MAYTPTLPAARRSRPLYGSRSVAPRPSYSGSNVCARSASFGSVGQVRSAGPTEQQLRTLQDQSARYINKLKQQVVQARYDAGQTFVGNVDHWSNADHLGPHAVASAELRKTLRSRSRYEVIENNPYLKGTILTVANDFVGAGPKLQITDKRISPERRRIIESKWQAWFKIRRMRQKLWRMRMSKLVDGESFMRAYRNDVVRHPVKLDFQVLEADRISSIHSTPAKTVNEVDGVRFDKFENPLAYHILHDHPGDQYLSPVPRDYGGTWVDSRFVIHWYRQDRGWLRGIPELAPSLPLCALLRRYTLAIVRHAETAADLTAIIETQGAPMANPWTDGQGRSLEDDPFDTFPIDIGSIMNLPWGYSIKQLEAVPLGTQYDEFVGAILREITRPILTPYNIAASTSKDSNMASGVLDTDIYKGGQDSERIDCDDVVLDKIFQLWWAESSIVPGHVGDDFLRSDRQFEEPPEHHWLWPKIGRDHTDPAKVAQALQMLHDKRFLTDEDIQTTYYNRDLETWQEQITAEDEFRISLPSAKLEQQQAKDQLAAKAAGPGNKTNSAGKKSNNPQAAGKKSNNRNRAKSKQPRASVAKR